MTQSQFQPLQWGVIGGGILGMTLAHRLRQQGHHVTLYEAGPELGGLASAWQLGEIVWDRHYHVTLLSDQHTRSILRELNLDTDMRWVETKTGVYADSTLYPISDAIEFLRFPPLGLLDKLRLGLTILVASRIKNWQRLEQIPVADWLTAWSGHRTFSKFWRPLLRSKLGENYQKAAATFIWATIARLYAARRSGLKKEMFGYLKGGYARFLQTFQERLITQGVNLRVDQMVQSIHVQPHGQFIVQSGSEQTSNTFDRVVVTTSSHVTAQLCPDLSPEETAKLKGIEYQGIICVSLVLRQPLSPYYVTNITEDWVPYTGVIEMTALVDRQELKGHTLIYLPKYISPEDKMWHESDDAIATRFIDALARMYPHFSRQDVLCTKISRVKDVFAIPTLNYSQTVPAQTTSVPGLYVVNSAQILNGTLNVNETILLAERAMEVLTQEI